MLSQLKHLPTVPSNKKRLDADVHGMMPDTPMCTTP